MAPELGSGAGKRQGEVEVTGPLNDRCWEVGLRTLGALKGTQVKRRLS